MLLENLTMYTPFFFFFLSKTLLPRFLAHHSYHELCMLYIEQLKMERSSLGSGGRSCLYRRKSPAYHLPVWPAHLSSHRTPSDSCTAPPLPPTWCMPYWLSSVKTSLLSSSLYTCWYRGQLSTRRQTNNTLCTLYTKKAWCKPRNTNNWRLFMTHTLSDYY